MPATDRFPSKRGAHFNPEKKQTNKKTKTNRIYACFHPLTFCYETVGGANSLVTRHFTTEEEEGSQKSAIKHLFFFYRYSVKLFCDKW